MENILFEVNYDVSGKKKTGTSVNEVILSQQSITGPTCLNIVLTNDYGHIYVHVVLTAPRLCGTNCIKHALIGY